MPDNSGAECYRRRAAEAHRLAELTENKALKEAFLRNAESWRERAREEHGSEQPEGLGDVEDRRARWVAMRTRCTRQRLNPRGVRPPHRFVSKSGL
jgi:hypothetical protein